jgi:uncharacterized Ntn-hydrolase superfamily protein
MTFSIAARCPASGMLGVALASSSIAVASRCAHTRARVGAALSQNVTLPSLGTRALELLADGCASSVVLARLAQLDAHLAWRQLILVPLHGEMLIYSGAHALGVHAEALGENCAAAGNLLASPEVPRAMVARFESSQGSLPERLLAALAAGVAAGGEAGPIHAAGLQVTEAQAWPLVDLRVDWSDQQPVAELARLWQQYQPQMQDYVMRALSPASAPGYAVAGAF